MLASHDPQQFVAKVDRMFEISQKAVAKNPSATMFDAISEFAEHELPRDEKAKDQLKSILAMDVVLDRARMRNIGSRYVGFKLDYNNNPTYVEQNVERRRTTAEFVMKECGEHGLRGLINKSRGIKLPYVPVVDSTEKIYNFPQLDPLKCNRS